MGLPVGEPVTGPPATTPPRVRLEGTFVALEPLDPEAHAHGLFVASHDGSAEADRLWTYMPYGPWTDEASMGEWVRELAGKTDPLFFAVVDLEAAAPIGMTSFLNVDAAMRHVELGHIWFAPSAQRTRANTEAAYLMLGASFDELGYRRVEWKCDALNARSRAAAERLGFTYEGEFRQHMVVKGRNRDTAWFAMLDGEWPAVRGVLERWLGEDPPPSLRELQAARGR